MKKLVKIALFSSMAVAGCKQTDAPEGKSAAGNLATAAKPVEATRNAAGAFPPGKYDLDAGHSVVLFKVRHLGAGYTYGWFKDVTGSVNVDRDLSKQSIELTVKSESVDSRDPKRDEHLRGPDFFNVAQFPTIKYKSVNIVPGAGNMLSVTGNLTIHGVTKSVTAQVAMLGSAVDPMVHATHVGYETKLVIKRSDFGMKFMTDLVGDDVELTIGIEAARGGNAPKK